MKRRLVNLLCVLLFYALISGSIGDLLDSKISFSSQTENDLHRVDRPPARRSLLSQTKEQDTALVAALDGTIHLLELKSAKVLWSFTSGPPIYSSYQTTVDHDNDKENASGPGGGYFVDCGDDWKLYANTILGKVKLDRTPEEFLHITPHIAEDGGVVLGSKKTTVFLVDAKTGRLIYSYKLSDHPSTSISRAGSIAFDGRSIEEIGISGSKNRKNDALPLYITRTDYFLASFAPNSDKVMWNLTVSDIGAAYLCQDLDNAFDEAPSSPGYKLPSEPDIDFNMPLPCQSRAVVFRLRGHGSLESLSGPGNLPLGQNEDMMPPMPLPNNMLPSQPKADKFLEYYLKNKAITGAAPPLSLPSPFSINESLGVDDNNDTEGVISLPSVTGDLVTSGVQNVKRPHSSILNILTEGSSASSVILLLLTIVGILTYNYAILARKQTELAKQHSDASGQAVPSKRKKTRKSGKSSSAVDKDKSSSSENDFGNANLRIGNKELLDLNQLTNGDIDGRTIGKLFVSNKEIAKGSNGTIVLEGIYDGRPVAVKRLVKVHHDVAFKEIQNLIASDQHPNIVRWYGVEHDLDFVYLALERCTCSLNDLIQMHSNISDKPATAEHEGKTSMVEYKIRLDSWRGSLQDAKLWKADGFPSPTLLHLMRDIVSGLVHLHELGIIHRDLKPQNVLIIKEKNLHAKLSDMGISKRLIGDMSSLGHHATGYGSSGWQAPEQLLHGRQTRAVDMFSLGCVLFFCITGGRHPFGTHLERDVNIVKNKVDLFLVEHIPEAVDLFSRLLEPLAELRPKALEVLHHPLFWCSETRLSFLRDASDRVELEDREANSDLLRALESVAPVALGGKWNEKMEPAFIANIGRYRRYYFESVRDLLRVVRNKLNHYRELPKEIQELLGSVPEGFDGYFSIRFPKLLIEVYKVMYSYCREEECFHKYFKKAM